MDNNPIPLAMHETAKLTPQRPYLAIVSDASGRVLATQLSPRPLNEAELDRLRVSALLRCDPVPRVIVDSDPPFESPHQCPDVLPPELDGDIAA